MAHGLTTIGNPDDGFTSVEIELDGEYAGRVFELESGWYVQMVALERLADPAVVDAIIAAKERLIRYVNRKGGDFPADATRGGISLWLMQRDDGEGFTVSTDV
jgi:hypothetical protein